MISKTMIAITLGSTLVASAMVYAGVAHRRHESAAATTMPAPAAQLPAVPKPAAGTPLNDGTEADATNDPNAVDQQSADSADDSNQDQTATDDQANTSDSDQGSAPAVIARRQTTLYTAAAVPPSPGARIRVVRSNHAAVAAKAVSLDRPAAPIASVAKASSSPIILPVGTELAFRLDEPLGSKTSHTNQSFAAILDRDVDVRGMTAIPAGSRATGKVVFARLAGRFAGEANLQLEIDSIKINRHEFAIHTTIRSFGPLVQAKNKVGRFMKGIATRMDGEEREVVLEDQTAYAFNLSEPLEIR